MDILGLHNKAGGGTTPAPAVSQCVRSTQEWLLVVTYIAIVCCSVLCFHWSQCNVLCFSTGGARVDLRSPEIAPLSHFPHPATTPTHRIISWRDFFGHSIKNHLPIYYYTTYYLHRSYVHKINFIKITICARTPCTYSILLLPSLCS